MKSFRSFTLSEVMIVLAISGVVALVAFETISLVRKQLFFLRENIEYKDRIEVVECVLLHDLNTHKTYYKKMEQNLYFYSQMDTIAYKLKDTVLVRGEDTLSEEMGRYLFFFGGKKIEEGWIDAIQIQFYNKENKIEIFVSSPNDATAYYRKKQ